MTNTFRFFNGAVKISVGSDKELWQVHSAAAKRVTLTENQSPLRHEQAKQDYTTTFGLLAARGIVVEPYPELSQPVENHFEQVLNMVSEGQMYLFGVECE